MRVARAPPPAVSGTSLIPAGLDKALTAEELRDLMTYLLTDRAGKQARRDYFTTRRRRKRLPIAPAATLARTLCTVVVTFILRKSGAISSKSLNVFSIPLLIACSLGFPKVAALLLAPCFGKGASF